MGKSVLTTNFAIAAEVAMVGLCQGSSETRTGQATVHAYRLAHSQTPWITPRFCPQS